MLRELRIENLLLIERAGLEFGPGLNVLTGETGAGKTVLAHSLDLLMGGKARPDIVRPGAGEAWVEGVFDLPGGWSDDPELAAALERLPAGSDELILGRRVSASGRTSAFVGGRGAAAGDLRLLTSRLIAFYGQHEHRRLTIGSAQTAMVDNAGDAGHRQLLERYRECREGLRKVESELSGLEGPSGSERDLDLLRFELEEIEAAAPEPGEPEALDAELALLRRGEELRAAAETAVARLRGDALGPDGGIVTGLGSARELLVPLAGLDPEIDRLAGRLEEAALELEDTARELGARAEAVETDPGRLTEAEGRRELLGRLERKHGGSIAGVIEHAGWCRREIERIEGAADRAGRLREKLERARDDLSRAAGKLGASRRRAADGLAGRITGDLAELAMSGATFTIDLVPFPDGPGPSGAEAAEFMLAPNPGMAAQPVRDAASGGELSRVMLALAASAGGAGDDGRTLVFDEIDAGIGGSTAGAVGDRLRRVSDRRQVLAITHLPQVAARASTHFSIVKEVDSGIATARVRPLAGDQVVDEIRRMMGAAPGDEAATRHAAELIAAQG